MNDIGCNCGSKKKSNVQYVVRYTDGGSTAFSSLREAQEDLNAKSGAGRISKVRG